VWLPNSGESLWKATGEWAALKMTKNLGENKNLALLAACWREDFSPNTIGGKIAVIEHV